MALGNLHRNDLILFLKNGSMPGCASPPEGRSFLPNEKGSPRWVDSGPRERGTLSWGFTDFKLTNITSLCASLLQGGSTPLGRLRLALSNSAQSSGDLTLPLDPHFLWVTEFPLFTRADEDKEFLAHGRWSSSHHPFTAPMWQDVQKMHEGRIGEVSRVTAFSLARPHPFHYSPWHPRSMIDTLTLPALLHLITSQSVWFLALALPLFGRWGTSCFLVFSFSAVSCFHFLATAPSHPSGDSSDSCAQFSETECCFIPGSWSTL